MRKNSCFSVTFLGLSLTFLKTIGHFLFLTLQIIMNFPFQRGAEVNNHKHYFYSKT